MNWQNNSRRLTSSKRSARRLFLFPVILLGITIPAGAATLHTRTTSMQSVQLVGNLPYHNGPTLLCGDCHVTHGSQQHTYGGAQDRFTSGPATGLLKNAGVNEMCLSCHDGKSGAPDVVGSDVNGLADRSAGMFQSPGINSWMGHSLSSGPRAGSACDQCHSSGNAQLLCTDCHAPHGNGRPRNLRWASRPGAEPQFGLMVNPTAEGMAKYDSSNVAYATNDDDTLREVSNMCIDCHHGFSGNEAVNGKSGGHIRHPSYDGERNSTNNISQGGLRRTSSADAWNAGTGSGFEIGRLRFLAIGAGDFTAAKTVNASSNGVFCLTCHKAHGSTHAFGLAWNPTGKTAGKGCNQCHGL